MSGCCGELTSRIEGRTHIVSCTACEWSAATTYTPPELLDQTVYEMEISGLNPHDNSHIHQVARLFVMNLVAARTLIQGRPTLSYKEKPPDDKGERPGEVC